MKDGSPFEEYWHQDGTLSMFDFGVVLVTVYYDWRINKRKNSSTDRGTIIINIMRTKTSSKKWGEQVLLIQISLLASPLKKLVIIII